MSYRATTDTLYSFSAVLQHSMEVSEHHENLHNRCLYNTNFINLRRLVRERVEQLQVWATFRLPSVWQQQFEHEFSMCVSNGQPATCSVFDVTAHTQTYSRKVTGVTEIFVNIDLAHLTVEPLGVVGVACTLDAECTGALSCCHRLQSGCRV